MKPWNMKMSTYPSKNEHEHVQQYVGEEKKHFQHYSWHIRLDAQQE